VNSLQITYPISHVVEGVDLVSLNGAEGLGVITESTVLEVLGKALGGGEGKDGLEESARADAAEGKTGVGLRESHVNKVLAWSNVGFNTDFPILSTRMESVVAHVWVEVGLGQVFKIISAVPELNGQVLAVL